MEKLKVSPGLMMDQSGGKAENCSAQSSALVIGAPGSSTCAMWQCAAQRATQPHGEVGEITYFAANFPPMSPPLLTGNMRQLCVSENKTYKIDICLIKGELMGLIFQIDR